MPRPRFGSTIRSVVRLSALALLASLVGCGSKSGGGGSPSGPSAFLGTWTPMGQEAGLSVASEKCGTAIETDAITSNLTLVQGNAGNTIALTTSSGCAITFEVSGDTATAASGQMCTTNDTDAGETSVETVESYMLIVNGGTLTSTLTGTIVNTKAGKTEMCTISAEAEYSKG